MVMGVRLWSTCIQTSNACTARDIVWNCIALGRKCLLNIELKSMKKYYFFLQKVLHCLRMGVCCVMLQLLKLLHYITHCHVTVVTLHCPLPCYTTLPWGASVYQGAIRGGPAPPCHPRPRKSFLFQISWW